MENKKTSNVIGKIIGFLFVVLLGVGIFFGVKYLLNKIKNNMKIKGVYYYDGTIYEDSDDFKDNYGYLYLENKNENQGKLYENLYHTSIDFLHKKKDLEEYNDQNLSLFGLNKMSKYKVTLDQALQTYEIFERDNPEFYWLTNIYTDETNTQISFSIDMDYVKYEDRLNYDNIINSKLHEIDLLMSTTLTEFQKVYKLYHYIDDNMEYNYDDLDTCFDHNIIGFFVNKLGVCECYSETFMLLCNRYGITNIQLWSNEHAWNTAKVNDKWYIFDVTNDFFGKSEDFYSEYGDTYKYNKLMYTKPEISETDII